MSIGRVHDEVQTGWRIFEISCHLGTFMLILRVRVTHSNFVKTFKMMQKGVDELAKAMTLMSSYAECAKCFYFV